MQKRGKKIKIEMMHKKTGEVLFFESCKEAAAFVGVTPMQISRMINHGAANRTPYFITS